MNDFDDISKLEELLAAENSDSDEEIETKPIKNTSKVEPISQISTHKFLEDVVQEELNALTSSRNKISPKNTISDAIKCGSAKESLVHGDSDSSDDEDRGNQFEKKYDDYGSEIKKIIASNKNVSSKSYDINQSSFSKKNQPRVATTSAQDRSLQNKVTIKTIEDVYSDPIFGIRISNPLISGAALVERMQGREPINMSKVKRHVINGDVAKDWVIAGVIVRKSSSKESQKGSQYSIWTLSDLRDDLKTVSMFLFRNAHKQLWKLAEGTVVGVLNPSVLDKRDDSPDQACLSVDNPERVMIMGKSKDFGFCKSRKKNGEQCTSFVNLFRCPHCIYHVKQEYQKCSKRVDLQGSISNRGAHDLRNKVLGKNTVIYGGKSYSAIPALKNKKQNAKDNNRLQSLNDYFKTTEQNNFVVNKSPIINGPKKKMASQIDINRSQRLKDLERIAFLKDSVPEKKENFPTSPTDRVQSNTSKTISPLSQSKLTFTSPNAQSKLPSSPVLGFGLKKESVVDLSLPYAKRQSEKAKLNALKWIKEHGPIGKKNPNNVRGTTEGKKRLLDNSEKTCDVTEPLEKKAKNGILSDDFKKMLQATSSHADLVIQHDNDEQDKYFDKLEKKEAMEEKMLNTFKVPCKGVRCLECSYTSFSASEKCKQEKHPLKVFDTFKRFFKCSHCGNRTVSLDLIPMHSCKNCQNSKWQRAPMMNERKGVTLADTLSIRGGEEKFIGSVIHTGANINLLVPDE